MEQTRSSQEITREHLRRVQRDLAYSYNIQAHGPLLPPFQPGDEVMLNSPNAPPGRSNKFRRLTIPFFLLTFKVG